MFRHAIVREIALVLLLKVAALMLLFVLFFGPDKRPDLTAADVGRAFTGGDTASEGISPP